MFKKTVKFNETVYSYHEVTEIKHVKDRNTTIRVKSYINNPHYMISQSIDQIIYLDFNDTLTFEMAESLAINRPEFEEYVDVEQALLQELAPSLTDEQASTVQTIYPEWNPEGVYSVGDRVRYSNGFYKCLQEHNAQIN